MQLLEKLNTDTAEWQKGGPSVDSRVGRSSLGHQHCCDSAQMSPIRWHSMSNTAFLLNLAKTDSWLKIKQKPAPPTIFPISGNCTVSHPVTQVTSVAVFLG